MNRNAAMLSIAFWLYRLFRSAFARPSVGQGTVEFAMVCLFGFLPMVFGTLEIGRGVWYYNQLSQLSREGARWIIVTSAEERTNYLDPGNRPGTYNVGTCACPNTGVGWIGQMDVGIPRDQITVTISGAESPGDYYHGAPVTVAVSYPYQPILTSFLNIPATITMQASTTMQME
jgi:hypothetical protein